MLPGSLLDDLSPYARVATALVPFILAMLARVCFGRSRTVSWLITLGTVWFMANILTAPFSDSMQREIQSLSHHIH